MLLLHCDAACSAMSKKMNYNPISYFELENMTHFPRPSKMMTGYKQVQIRICAMSPFSDYCLPSTYIPDVRTPPPPSCRRGGDISLFVHFQLNTYSIESEDTQSFCRRPARPDWPNLGKSPTPIGCVFWTLTRSPACYPLRQL